VRQQLNQEVERTHSAPGSDTAQRRQVIHRVGLRGTGLS